MAKSPPEDAERKDYLSPRLSNATPISKHEKESITGIASALPSNVLTEASVRNQLLERKDEHGSRLAKLAEQIKIGAITAKGASKNQTEQPRIMNETFAIEKKAPRIVRDMREVDLSKY